MSFKIVKSNAKNNLKNKYFKFFLISLIAFVMSLELKIVLKGLPELSGIVQVSYIMVLTGIIIKPVYVTWLKKVYLTGDFRGKLKEGSYFKITGAFFIRKALVFVSLFILIFPGIYKALEYIFLPYIMAEKENISIKEAFLESSALTKGKKLMIFKFVLSFCWQYVLGFFCVGMGIIFVNPYFEMCLKELYIYLKDS